MEENREIRLAKSILESKGYSLRVDNEYYRMMHEYKYRCEFLDRERNSGNIADLLDYLDTHNIVYEIYYNSKDRGCTVFYDAKERLFYGYKR